jgi:hypothetical protein
MLLDAILSLLEPFFLSSPYLFLFFHFAYSHSARTQEGTFHVRYCVRKQRMLSGILLADCTEVAPLWVSVHGLLDSGGVVSSARRI